jgi:predicted DNA-binding transcriptional regulator AlpA
VNIPSIGYLRLKQIIGDPKATPPIPPILPIGRSTFWLGVKSGRFPAPVKLGPRTTAWTVESIKELVKSLSTTDGPAERRRGTKGEAT